MMTMVMVIEEPFIMANMARERERSLYLMTKRKVLVVDHVRLSPS